MNNVDEVFYAYIIHDNKEYDFYLIKFHSKIASNYIGYSEYVKSNLFDNKTMVSCKSFFRKGN